MLKIETYFPSTILTNADLAATQPDYNMDRLSKKIGIEQRYVCSPNETALDLAIKACEKLLVNEDKSSIDFLIYCTQSPEYFLPTTACILQHNIGLKTSCGALDYNLGCSGYVYGLALAKSLLLSKTAQKVLLVTAETYSKHIHKNDITNRAIFGDAATATLIDEEGAKNILDFTFGTNGEGAQSLIVKGGAGAQKFCSSTHPEDLFYMDGPKVYEFTLDCIPNSIEECLQKNKMQKSDIQYFILHQANKYMLNQLRKKIDVPEDKFHNEVTLTGNTVSNTIPIALKQSMDNVLVKPNDYVLLSGFGVGLSWASTIIKL